MEEFGSWTEYRRLVMAGLEKNAQRLDGIDRRLSRIETDLAQLKVKSGIWGAVAGIITTMGVLLIALASNLFGG